MESVRQRFGYIHPKDPSRIYVARIADDAGGSNRYRLHIPPGHRFLLHIADTEIPDRGYLEDPKPTKTMSMNSSREEGADVVLKWAIYDSNTARNSRSRQTPRRF